MFGRCRAGEMASVDELDAVEEILLGDIGRRGGTASQSIRDA
jgi:hypothetical protein